MVVMRPPPKTGQEKKLQKPGIGQDCPQVIPAASIIKRHMPDFEFNSLREAANYRRLLVREIGAWVRGKTLEVGCGIGQMSGVLQSLPHITHLECVEPEESFCLEFKKTFPAVPVVCGTVADIAGDWDSIVSINVLEHIENDRRELGLYRDRLAGNGGVLALFVPARQELYAPIDKAFGHFRRYGRAEILEKLGGAGFTIEAVRYCDFIGYFSWLLIHKWLRRDNFNRAALLLFDRCFFPPENWMETNVCNPPFGKNLLAIARAAGGGMGTGR